MSCRATAEVLSAYLDRELPRPQLRLVETHLEECEECRRRLDGLGKVTRQLRSLERLAPPPVIGQRLERRLARVGERRDLLERVEARLGGFELNPSIGLTFALVFAFALILFLYADWSEYQMRQATRLVVPAAEPAPFIPVRYVAGRTFEFHDGLWLERGLAYEAEKDPSRTPVEADSERGRALLAAVPELQELLETGDRLVLSWEPEPGARELVELRSATPGTS